LGGGSRLLLIGAFSVPLTIVHLREPAQTSQTIRFDFLMPQGATDAGAPPAISPDGKVLVFVARQGGRRQLWVRPLDSTAARVIEGTDDANHNIHSANDTMAHINFDLALEILRMNTAFVAQTAGRMP